MIRPASFGFNHETAQDNFFQNNQSHDAAEMALKEFDDMVFRMQQEGISVEVFEDDKEANLPDAIFPNNWLGLHPGGIMALYPMYADIRRKERRSDLIHEIRMRFNPRTTCDFTHWEAEHQFCEGTGSLVFDHLHFRVYAAISNRTSATLVEELAKSLGYEAIVFETSDSGGYPYYHTNVIMTIGTEFAILCAECISVHDYARVLKNLNDTGREVILISREQVNAFCGNMLEIRNSLHEPIILLSESAAEALNPFQWVMLQKYGLPLQVSIPTIERIGGGSVRCMIAESFI